MGYLDSFAANIFRERRDGQRVIAPFGIFGRVYEVPSEEVAVKITNAVRRMAALMLLCIVAVQTTFGWHWNLLAGPLLLMLFYTRMYVLTRGLPPAGVAVRDLVPVSRGEMMARSGRALGRRWLLALLALSVGFVAAGVVLWTKTHEPIALFAGAFFLACGSVFAYQLVRLDRRTQA